MKKLLIAIIAFLAISVATVEAQPRAIGARVGYGVEASYQHSIGNNMVSVDFGLPAFPGIEAAATYDWIFPITSWTEAGEWNWYAGVGAGGGYNWAHPLVIGYSIPYGFVGLAGRIGVEYNFTFPLQLSLDWRPLFGPAFASGAVAFNTGSLYAGAFALGVRYRF